MPVRRSAFEPRITGFAAFALIALAGPAAGETANTPSRNGPGSATAAVTCSRGPERCPPIAIDGDRRSTTPTFNGHADPVIRHDPAVPARIWMLYSYLEGRLARRRDGKPAGIPHVSTRLARSDDAGRTFRLVRTLWDSRLVRDPENLGPDSFFGSETPNLTVRQHANGTTWYSVRLSYFLEPVTAYSPRYASSWTMRVAQDSTPAALADSDEAVLGTRTTHAAYGPHVRLTALANELSDCGMWNNPAVAFEGERLYVIAECLAFDGKKVSDTRSRVVVFRTNPNGPPPTWQWEYAGVLADHALARSLGGTRVVSPDISSAADGKLLLVLALRSGDDGLGCVALLLDSLDPPRIGRDGGGKPAVRARISAERAGRWHIGACTHDPKSATGVVGVAASTGRGLQAELRATGLRP